MKRYILLFLSLVFIPLMAFVVAENPFILKIVRNLALINSRLPEEKIYVTTDKPFYKPGETIWLAAFVVNGLDNKSSGISDIAPI
jgi:alpha-2-macroglobulin-like protein